MRKTLEQFKVKGLSLCFVLNLRMPRENCSIFNRHSFRAAPGISLFRLPRKDDEYSANWRNNIVAIITRDRVIDGNLKRAIKNQTLHTCELHYPQEKMIRRK